MHKLNLKLQKAYMLVTLIEKYREENFTGLHIVIDDGNVDDRDIKYCLENAEKSDDFWSMSISKLLLEFSPKERDQIISSPWEIEEQIRYRLDSYNEYSKIPSYPYPLSEQADALSAEDYELLNLDIEDYPMEEYDRIEEEHRRTKVKRNEDYFDGTSDFEPNFDF